MEGFIDWNKLTIEQYIEHLENKFRFDSSGTAKAVFELINAYRALTIHNVSESVCDCVNTEDVNVPVKPVKTIKYKLKPE